MPKPSYGDRAELTLKIGDALKLNAGDRVLVAFSHAGTPEQTVWAQNMLMSRFPGVEFTVAFGVSSVAWQPAEGGEQRG